MGEKSPPCLIWYYAVQACYIRKALHLNRTRWENLLEASGFLDSVLTEWFKLLEECKRRAQDDLYILNEQILGQGWAAKNVLLNTKEQTRYSFIDD